jgi:hypothetical protein
MLAQVDNRADCYQSVNLTKVPLPPRLVIKSTEPQEEKYEYSSRELKPAALLLRDLIRAHSIFLLHHDTSLSALFVRCKRTRFAAMLSRYWDLFLSTWNVMLHGNPVRNIFGGINIAASGELGVGVGEEERGSGEREVLEGLVGRIEGLVDLVASKFGTEEADDDVKTHRDRQDSQLWLGSGEEPAAEDGAIFLGTGALSRKSVRDVTHWMEDLYQWGDHAYGVIDSPTSTRGKRTRKSHKSVDETKTKGVKGTGEETADKKDQNQVKDGQSEPQRKPEQQEQKKPEEGSRETAETQEQPPEQSRPESEASPKEDESTPSIASKEPEDGKFDKMFSYMKLGYGSYWTLPGTNTNTPTTQSGTDTASESTAPKHKHTTSTPPLSRPKLARRASSDAHGHYLIGLKGSISDAPSDSDSSASSTHNSRTLLRTINVELDSKASTQSSSTTIIKDFGHPASPLTQSQVVGSFLPGYSSHDLNKSEKLRVVVYVNRPFMFTFFFKLHTDSLAWDTLYRSLHYQLAPLKKPLLASTAYRPEPERAAPRTIYNLVWDPKQLTIHSTIPNIPESSASDAWSRADAVNTHLHLLNIHATTRPRGSERERTHKTNRGWWIVWTRLLERAPSAQDTQQDQSLSPSRSRSSSKSGPGSGSETDGDDHPSSHEKHHEMVVHKEIFLIRRASDHVGLRSISTGDGGGGADGASRLVQGIGVDTRRYVEDLLTFL